MNPDLLAQSIELALFRADATRRDIEALCAHARQNRFHAVCVNTSRVELAGALLLEFPVRVVALVGFPLGAADADAKRFETEVALDLGAQEIDYVVNLGRLKDGDHQGVLREMRDIVEAADELPVKAVTEIHRLTPEEQDLVCRLVMDSGAKFLATSADFHAPPVTAAQVRDLCGRLGDDVRLKAAGAIPDLEVAEALIEAGATRIGMVAASDRIGDG